MALSLEGCECRPRGPAPSTHRRPQPRPPTPLPLRSERGPRCLDWARTPSGGLAMEPLPLPVKGVCSRARSAGGGTDGINITSPSDGHEGFLIERHREKVQPFSPMKPRDITGRRIWQKSCCGRDSSRNIGSLGPRCPRWLRSTVTIPGKVRWGPEGEIDFHWAWAP